MTWLLVSRSLHWAFEKGPLVRRVRPVNSTPSILMDACDLAFTCRGYGWNWSSDIYTPPETRPSNRTGFVFHVVLSAIAHAFICGVSHRAIRSFSPAGLDSVSGASIFDETLPFILRYARSSIITVVGGFTTYAFLQMAYDMCTLLGVLLLQQDPAQWAPSFDSPWLSTSLSQFWGRRWHQWLRHMFLVQAGHPLSLVFGRAGLVIGAFLSSAVYHYVALYSLDPTSEPWRMIVGFMMMVPGIFAEPLFKQLTGRRVCGVAGWIWTTTWLVVWGSVVMDGFVRAGLFKSDTLIDGIPPLRSLVERLVMYLDARLHA